MKHRQVTYLTPNTKYNVQFPRYFIVFKKERTELVISINVQKYVLPTERWAFQIRISLV